MLCLLLAGDLRFSGVARLYKQIVFPTATKAFPRVYMSQTIIPKQINLQFRSYDSQIRNDEGPQDDRALQHVSMCYPRPMCLYRCSDPVPMSLLAQAKADSS